MHIFLTTLHVMACLVLILVVLLQRGKGAEMGAMLGGGSSNTVFGARGAGNFLTKITTGCAVIFMVTSLSLAYLGNLTESELVFDEEIEAEATPPESGLLEEVGDAIPAEGGPGALEEITPEALPMESE
ncbi:MAG: preprotein translocase subunit SecG [Myxococcota bacterium]